jgi:hypothetical protein
MVQFVDVRLDGPDHHRLDAGSSLATTCVPGCSARFDRLGWLAPLDTHRRWLLPLPPLGHHVRDHTSDLQVALGVQMRR